MSERVESDRLWQLGALADLGERMPVPVPRIEWQSRGWAGLLEAAKLKDGDDERCDGFFVRAQAIDFITGLTTGDQCWDDLCQEQVERIYECLGKCRSGRRIELGP